MVTAFLQTVWVSLLALGWVKVILAVIVLAILSKVHQLLGLIGLILSIAYLAHWI